MNLAERAETIHKLFNEIPAQYIDRYDITTFIPSDLEQAIAIQFKQGDIMRLTLFYDAGKAGISWKKDGRVFTTEYEPATSYSARLTILKREMAKLI